MSLSFCFPCLANRYIVDQNGFKDFTTIQAAINAANNGDQIEVAPGTYSEAINFNGKAIRLYSFGGPDVTTIEGSGHYHVVQCINGENSNTILEGFTIAAGNANGNWPDERGGGMYNYQSNPTVTNCIFSSNSADTGGGMYNEFCVGLTINNCTFSDNSAGFDGGGMFNDNSSLTVTDCAFIGNINAGMSNSQSSLAVTGCNFSQNSNGGINNSQSSPTVSDCNFSGNSYANSGGGMLNDSSSPTVTNCTFSGNSVYYYGGAMCNKSNSNPVVTDCSFNGNSSSYHGGGMYNYDSRPAVTGCTFSQNTASNFGGGMYNYHNSTAVNNCIFSNNSANYGGGMFNENSAPTVTNCTFSGNSAGTNGGGMGNSFSSSPTIINCILWGNNPNEIINYSGSSPMVSYSDVMGGYTGTGNINTNPAFAYPHYGDYHLRSIRGRWDPNGGYWFSDNVTSLCIDAGDPNSDWTGELWPHGKRINMGAFGGTAEASMSLASVGNIADFNNDDKVDCEDLKILCEFWLNDNLLVKPNLNRIGLIDFRDLCIFANNWLWRE